MGRAQLASFASLPRPQSFLQVLYLFLKLRDQPLVSSDDHLVLNVLLFELTDIHAGLNILFLVDLCLRFYRLKVTLHIGQEKFLIESVNL